MTRGNFMKYLVANLSKPARQLAGATARFKESTHITRTLDFHELFIVTEGELHIIHGGQKYALKAGDVFISERNVEYGGYQDSTCTFHWQHFIIEDYYVTEESPTENFSREKFYIPLHFHLDDYNKILVSLAQLEEATLSEQTEINQLIRDSLMSAILAQISNGAVGKNNKVTLNKRFHSIIEYAMTNPNLGDFKSVSEMAYYFGYNEKYLIRLFKKNVAVSPLQYFINRKIVIAKNMLADQEITIENIASFLNYDYNYFLKVFKTKVGMTPTEYRKAICPDWNRYDPNKMVSVKDGRINSQNLTNNKP